MKFIQKTISFNSSFFWILLLIVYPVFFMFQGLDFTDQGYWLTGYQWVFTNPESVKSMMTTWLSLVVGGLVEKTGLGVISFRIAYVVVVWATIWLAYRLLRECFNQKEILFPLFVALVYINKWGVNWLSYNDLSAMFFLAVSLALWLGLQHKSVKWILMSGSILGLGVYLRIPNVAGVALVVTIMFAGWLYEWSITFILKFVMVFLLGVTSGLLVGLLAMKQLGHLPYFFESISILAKQVTQPSYHHSSHILLKMFINDHIKALTYGMLLMGAVAFVEWIKRQDFFSKLQQSKIYWLAMRFGGVVIIITLVMYLEHGLRYRWVLPGFCYSVLMFGVAAEYRGGCRSHALLYFIALNLILIVPLGSNNGIGNAIYGSWLALPLSLLVLKRASKFRCANNAESSSLTEVNQVCLNKQSEFSGSSFQDKPEPSVLLTIAGLSKMIAGAVLVLSSHLAYISTYRDSADRCALRYGLSAPELKGILTSKARSQVVGELLTELDGIIKLGDQLLAVADIPMLNYLTHTRPYLSSSWIGIMDKEQLASDLLDIPKNGKTLPVVVRTKGSVHNPEWPNVGIDPNYLGDGELLIQKFMITYGYHKKWENDWFEIWTSNLIQ